MTKNINKELESGRSMVEMLGVLAVVGVLSVGGIAGYTYAMNKHYANELLMGASERAVLVTAQLASGRGPSLKEFAKHTTAGGTFATNDESVRVYSDGIGIEVSGVKGAVCKNLIEATEGTDIIIADTNDVALTEDGCDDENTLILTFETGIGGGETNTEPECDPACPTGQQCIGGACAEVTPDTCYYDPELDEDICEDQIGCSNNSDCDKWCETNGGGEKCYCEISADETGDESACYKNFTGQCAVARTESGVAGGYTVSDHYTTWWSAVNFCKAHNKSLVSLADLGIIGGYQDDANCEGSECICGEEECTETFWSDLQNKILDYDSYWVTDAVSCDLNTWECTSGTNNSSCAAFNVDLSSGAVIVCSRNNAGYDYYRALCE